MVAQAFCPTDLSAFDPFGRRPRATIPLYDSDSLNLLVELGRVDGVRSGNVLDRNSLFARVKVPRSTPRLVAVPSQIGRSPCPDDLCL